MLKVKNLKKTFGGVKAVDGCNFEIEKNTITALIGPNGSGKSTVFNIISGIEKEEEGGVNFNGKDITNFKPESVSNIGISRLFQQNNLFDNLTVKQNLLLGLDKEDTKFWKNFLGLNKVTKDKKDKIQEFLQMIEMDKFENILAQELSYGQKRLVELGRATIKEHKFLMLDEPVAGVNPNMREKIVDLLEKLKSQNETVLLIEHDMNFTLKMADRIVVLDKGKVIAEDTPEEIRNNQRVLDAYLGD